jgi:signal peptide peptidase-like protein 2B
MSLTFIALYFEVGGQGGQPALTYLVPTVVGTSMLLGWKHGNLGEMWNGHDGYDVLPSETQSML